KPVPRRKAATPALEGDPPNPVNRPPGCHFHPRCPHAMPICATEYPAPRAVAPGRVVACHLYNGGSEEMPVCLRRLGDIAWERRHLAGLREAGKDPQAGIPALPRRTLSGAGIALTRRSHSERSVKHGRPEHHLPRARPDIPAPAGL